MQRRFEESEQFRKASPNDTRLKPSIWIRSKLIHGADRLNFKISELNNEQLLRDYIGT